MDYNVLFMTLNTYVIIMDLPNLELSLFSSSVVYKLDYSITSRYEVQSRLEA